MPISYPQKNVDNLLNLWITWESMSIYIERNQKMIIQIKFMIFNNTSSLLTKKSGIGNVVKIFYFFEVMNYFA